VPFGTVPFGALLSSARVLPVWGRAVPFGALLSSPSVLAV
jgi:hypothetical protein